MTDRCGFQWAEWAGEDHPHECRLDEDHLPAHSCVCGAEHDPIIEGDT